MRFAEEQSCESLGTGGLSVTFHIPHDLKGSHNRYVKASVSTFKECGRFVEISSVQSSSQIPITRAEHGVQLIAECSDDPTVGLLSLSGEIERGRIRVFVCLGILLESESCYHFFSLP